jgi:hypothetical protein
MATLINPIKSYLALSIGALSFFYCSNSIDVAGTATETTNGYVLASNGNPVAHAMVRLIDAQNWLSRTAAGKSSVIDSTLTDTYGRFVIEVPKNYPTNLQLDNGEQGALVADIYSVLSLPPCSVSISLKNYASLRGSLRASLTEQKELFLFGSAYRLSIGADNAFYSAKIPEGVFALVVRRQSIVSSPVALAGAVALTAGDSVNTGAITADTGRIPVEDFSQGWMQTMLGRVIGGGWWYTFLDTGEFQGNSYISVINQSVGGYQGKSLQTKICLGNAISYPFGGTGFQVGDPRSEGYNVTAMKKFSFWAKGRGKVNVSLQTRMLEKIPGNSDQFSILITIPANWTRIEIPVESLKLSPGSPADLAGVLWKDAAASLLRVQFSVTHHVTTIGDTVEYWLDDIAFEGVGIGALIH